MTYSRPALDYGIVDSHHHLWDHSTGFDYSWQEGEENAVLRKNFMPDTLHSITKTNQIEQTVVVQAVQSVEELHWLLKIADENPFITGVVGWVDLKDKNVSKTLETVAKHPKLKGIRHVVQEEPDDNWLLQEDVISGLKDVASFNLTYDVLIVPRHMKSVPILAEKIPNLRMVIDHIAKPFIKNNSMSPWDSEMSEIAKIPTAYCKISGMVTEANVHDWKPEDLFPYIEHVINVFGPERIMYGSDWPVCLRAATYEEVLDTAIQGSLTKLNKSEMKQFLRTNAIKFNSL